MQPDTSSTAAPASAHNEATTSALPGSDDGAAVIHASVGGKNAEIRRRIKVTILHVGDAPFAVRGQSERATNLALRKPASVLFRSR
jgi:hypothetical protein